MILVPLAQLDISELLVVLVDEGLSSEVSLERLVRDTSE